MSEQVVLFGATGRLGREIYRGLKEQYAQDGVEIAAPAHGVVDLLNTEFLTRYLHLQRPCLIINCSAMNGLEACEADPAKAFAINALAPLVMAAEARKLGAPLIHFSTDYACVRVGEDQTSAWGMYGTSKAMGESAILNATPFASIFRLSSIYSIDTLDGSLDPIKQYRAGKGKHNDPIKVLSQLTTPTSVRFIANTIMNLIPRIQSAPRKHHGIFPLTTSEAVWKSDFARAALSLFLKVEDVCLTEGTLPMARPQISIMDSSPFDAVFPDIVRPDPYQDLAENAEVWQSRQNDADHLPSPSHGA